jgi:hypothetical protein
MKHETDPKRKLTINDPFMGSITYYGHLLGIGQSSGNHKDIAGGCWKDEF